MALRPFNLIADTSGEAAQDAFQARSEVSERKAEVSCSGVDNAVPSSVAESRMGAASSYLESWQKAALDRVLGAALLLFFLPVLVAFAVAIVCTSRGHALFVQKRYGRRGNVFPIFKLRSMRAVASEPFKQAERGDARVTAIGRFIRKTSIDELPQLINVVKGEMSLVGPRPHPIALDDQYATQIKDYSRRFDAAPGMTGLAQVSRARGETPTVAHMRRRVEFDLIYVQEASWWLDLKILALTAREVFFSPTRDDVF